MMRRIALASMLTLAGTSAIFAQHGGGGHGGGGAHGGSGSQGGGSLHGAGMGGGFRGGGGFQGNNGFRGKFGNRFQFGNRFGSPFFNSGFFGWPWWGGWGLWGGWPLWDPFFDSSDYGSGGFPDYAYPSYGGYPNVGSGPGGSTPVIINQNLGSAPPPPPPPPTIQERTALPPPTQARANQQSVYLLAFQGGVIRAVLAYSMDGDTLHYLTMDSEQKQAPLSAVDRTLSERLNRERNVTFQLPRSLAWPRSSSE